MSRVAVFAAILSAGLGCEGTGGTRTFGIAPGEPGFPAAGAVRLAFVIPPSNVAVGAFIVPPVIVAVLNSNGDPVLGTTSLVTIEITPSTGTPGAILAGTRSRLAVNGLVTFDDLTISLPGVSFSLTARSAGLVPAISGGFAVTTIGTTPTTP